MRNRSFDRPLGAKREVESLAPLELSQLVFVGDKAEHSKDAVLHALSHSFVKPASEWKQQSLLTSFSYTVCQVISQK
jgi:hypothetical protein